MKMKKAPKVGSRAFGERARDRRDKLVGKSDSAKAMEERQRQERGAGLVRPNLRKKG